MNIKQLLLLLLIPFFSLNTLYATQKTWKKTYSSTISIYPLSSSVAISNLSVSGNVTFNHDTSLVRIIVKDINGIEYQLYETYPLCASANSFSFNLKQEETRLLKNIKPARVIVVCQNAQVYIDYFNYSTASTSLTDSYIESQRSADIRNENSLKINQIASNSNIYNTDWTPNHTQLSCLAFNVKRYHLGGTSYNQFGYEFYKGGVFSIPTKDGPLKTGSSDGYVKEFDLRKLHNAHLPSSPYYDGDEKGGGWATPVKNQLWNSPLLCGSCYIHAAVATLEMHANLYYNQHIDLDLSEQKILSCTKKDCSGGFVSSIGWYLWNLGTISEEKFPYVGYEQPCDQYSWEEDDIYIADTFINLHSTFRKRDLIARGPSTMSTGSHAMLLVGWKTNDEGKTVWICKNSHGYDHGDNGYTDYDLILYSTYQFQGPITNINKEVRCVDFDGDGYYNWGYGPKPSTCPSCAPDIKDWNDDDATVAEIDQYGNLLPITSPPIAHTKDYEITQAKNYDYWKNDTTLCESQNIFSNRNDDKEDWYKEARGVISQGNIYMLSNIDISIRNCAFKTIGSKVDNASFIVNPDGKLIIADSELTLNGGDKISVKTGGRLVLTKCSFIIN